MNQNPLTCVGHKSKTCPAHGSTLRWIVYIASYDLLVKSFCLLTSDVPINTVTLRPVLAWAGSPAWAGVLCLVGASAALFAMLGRSRGVFGLLFSSLQQAILLMGAFSGYTASHAGAYADGYVPLGGWRFIFSDQSFQMAFAVFHFIALLDRNIISAGRPIRGTRNT